MGPYKPIFAPSSDRPESSRLGGGMIVVRDQFEASTLLLVGACLVGLAFLLTRSPYVFVPVYAALAYRVFQTVRMLVGWKSNEYMEGVLPGKFTAQLPPVEGEEDVPGASGIVVFMLGFRINHPLGLLAPGAKEVGDWSAKCYDEVKDRYDEYGLLGMSNFLGMERSTGNENMTLMYFKNTEGLHKFAMDPAHRATWNWWLSIQKRYPHLGIMHETYDVPARHWEAVYLHMHKTGLSGASVKLPPSEDEIEEPGVEGKQMWWSTPVDANKGKMRSSRGRMDRSEGDENEKAGLDY